MLCLNTHAIDSNFAQKYLIYVLLEIKKCIKIKHFKAITPNFYILMFVKI